MALNRMIRSAWMITEEKKYPKSAQFADWNYKLHLVTSKIR